METDPFKIRGTPKISPEGKIIGYGVKPVEMPRGDMSGEDHSSKYKAMVESFNPQRTPTTMASAYSTDPNSNMSEADKNNTNRLGKMNNMGPNTAIQKPGFQDPKLSLEQPGVSRAYNPGAYAQSPLMSPALGQGGAGTGGMSLTPYQGPQSSAIVPRAAGALGPVQANEIPGTGGKIVGLSPKGMAAAGGAMTAASVANEMIPRSSGDTYGGQVVNNLRDTFSRMSTGAGVGATIGSVVPVVGNAVGAGLGAVAGGAYDIGKKIYDGGKDLLELPQALMGVRESNQKLQNATTGLEYRMRTNPQNVTQATYDGLATANRQIARNEGTPTPAGVPATGNIVNAPIPQGMPAPVPMAALPRAQAAGQAAPYNPGSVSNGATDWNARFKKETGTAFNGPKSAMDRMNMERLQQGLPTLDRKQYRAILQNQ